MYMRYPLSLCLILFDCLRKEIVHVVLLCIFRNLFFNEIRNYTADIKYYPDACGYLNNGLYIIICDWIIAYRS